VAGVPTFRRGQNPESTFEGEADFASDWTMRGGIKSVKIDRVVREESLPVEGRNQQIKLSDGVYEFKD
jgi:hypothetical protein